MVKSGRGIAIFRSGVIALSLLFFPATFAIAQSRNYGDVEVSVRSVPQVAPQFGYVEYLFSVTNKTAKPHSVTLTLPGDSSRGNEDAIENISRTVVVEANGSALVPLFHPVHVSLSGSSLRVAVDGRNMGDLLPVKIVNGNVRERTRIRGGFFSSPMTSPMYGALDPAVLVSSPLKNRFDYVDRKIGPNRLPGTPNAGSPPVPSGFSDGPSVSPYPTTSWSPRWLAYSGYNGVVISEKELESLEKGGSETREIRDALLQYATAGGCLIVMKNEGDKDSPGYSIPSHWEKDPGSSTGEIEVFRIGFGHLLKMNHPDSLKWKKETWDKVTGFLMASGQPFSKGTSFQQANDSFKVNDNHQLPLGILFFLMLVFSIVIGPVNMWILASWKRHIWLLWTVPLISLLTCLGVFVTMILAEGWQGKSRLTAFTILDEKEQLATSLGRSALYSPVTPSGGLHFSTDTEAQLYVMDDNAGRLSCDIDWTKDQNFSRGWVPARTPVHFQLRRSERKRLERLAVTHSPDGSIRVSNQLGVRINKLHLRDSKGKLFLADAIPVGEEVTLQPDTKKEGWVVNPLNLDTVFSNDWANYQGLYQRIPSLVRPGTYFAEVESSPFLSAGLKSAAEIPNPSIIYGIMAE